MASRARKGPVENATNSTGPLRGSARQNALAQYDFRMLRIHCPFCNSLLVVDDAMLIRRLVAGVTTIQRLNTQGGAAYGRCEAPGQMLSVAYSADYAFYRKPRWSLIPNTARND